MRVMTVGILGVAALAAGIFLVRGPRQTRVERDKSVQAGERYPGTISPESLKRIREQGY